MFVIFIKLYIPTLPDKRYCVAEENCGCDMDVHGKVAVSAVTTRLHTHHLHFLAKDSPSRILW
jgi:hypothetical protein